MSKLVKNSLFYIAGRIIPKAFSFILLPIYTNYLSPGEFGIVNSMQVFASILTIFFSFGLERSIYRLYYDYKTVKEIKDFIGTITIALLIISTILSIFVLLNSSIINNIFKSIEFYPYYFLAIITAYLSIFEIIPKIYLQVTEKAKLFLIISIIQLFFNTICTLYFVVYLKQGAYGMMYGTIVGCLFTLPLFIIMSLKNMNFSFKWNILSKSFFFSIPLVPSLLANWVINLSDRIFIEKYFSAYEVGIYSLGYKIGQFVTLLASSILMAYNPYFYKLANSQNQEQAKSKLFKTNNLIIIVFLSISFIISFFSKDIILLFFDSKYAESYKFIPIIAFGAFFIQLISLQNLSFYQEKKTIKIMLITITSAVVNILFNFILIPPFGSIGAAYSTILTQVFYFLIVYANSKKYYFIPYNWKIIVPLLTLIFVLIFLSYIFIPTNIYTFSIKCFVFIVITIILGYKGWKNKNLQEAFGFIRYKNSTNNE